MCISIDGYDKTLIKNNPNLTRLTVYMIIVGLLTTIAICLVQICVSQIMGPIIGYIAVVVILIMGVFFRSFLFIGNGFMALRNIMYTPEGEPYADGYCRYCADSRFCNCRICFV